MKLLNTLVAVGCAGLAQATVVVIDVPATSNIYGAGYGDTPAPGGGGGGTPAVYAFDTTVAGDFYFTVTGLTNFSGGTPDTGAEGALGETIVNPHRAISGARAPRQGYLAGIWLPEKMPA